MDCINKRGEYFCREPQIVYFCHAERAKWSVKVLRQILFSLIERNFLSLKSILI